MVCGYIPKGNSLTSIVLGQYADGRLQYKGHVTPGVGGENFRKIRGLPPNRSAAFLRTCRKRRRCLDNARTLLHCKIFGENRFRRPTAAGVQRAS